MASATADFVARLRGDVSDVVQKFRNAGREIDRAMDMASNSTERLDNALVKIGRGVVGGLAFGQIIGLSKDLVKATAQLEDTVAAASVTFGDYSKQVEDFASTAATSFGLSKRVAMDAANTFAALGKSAGQTGADLAKFATDMVALAGDMASFRGTSVEDAIAAIGAGLRGEAEPLRRYGVLLDDATLKARALAMGIYAGTGALTPQQKVLAAHAEILAQTSDAQGDFARTADSTANSMKTASAEMENAKAAAGEALAPALTAVAQAAVPVLNAFSELPDMLQSVVVVGTGAAGAFSAASSALQGLGVSAKTANLALGPLTATIAVATLAYSVYAQEKQKATQRTNDLADALRQEGDAQRNALAEMAKGDPNVRRFLEAMTGLGLTTEQVAQYVNSGTGELAGMTRQFTGLQGKVQGIYPQLAAFAYQLQGVSLEGANYTEMAQGMTQEQIDAAAATRDFFSELIRLRNDYIATENAADLAAIATGEFKDATVDAATSAEEAAKALEENKKAIQSANDAYQKQIDLIEKLYGDQRDAIERQRDFAKSQREVKDALSDAEASVQSQMDAIEAMSEDYATLYGDSLNSVEGTNRQISALEALLSTIKPGSELYKAIDEYKRQLASVPPTVETLFKIGLPDGMLFGSGIASSGGASPTMIKTKTGDIMSPASVWGAGKVNLTVNVYKPVASGEQIANELAGYIRRNGTSWLSLAR